MRGLIIMEVTKNMYLDQNIKINSMVDVARKTFDSTDKRLEGIENNFHSKMQGKTLGEIIGSFLGTIIWIVAFGWVAYYLYYQMNRNLFLITIGAVGLLMLVMLIDECMNFKFYSKVSPYGLCVSQLRSRVRVGRESISANIDTYLKTKDKGWDYNLEVGESIPDEATIIEETMSSMESLKNGFINSFKTGVYYIVAILITIVGSTALFPTASQWLYDFFKLSNDALLGICGFAMMVVCVGECFIAKLVWSWTDCNVNNMTIFGALVGPIAFCALILVGSAVVGLIIAVVSIVLYLAALAIGIACVCGSISGG